MHDADTAKFTMSIVPGLPLTKGDLSVSPSLLLARAHQPRQSLLTYFDSWLVAAPFTFITRVPWASTADA